MTLSDFNRLVAEMRFCIGIPDATRRDQALSTLAGHFAKRIAPDEIDEVFERCRQELTSEVLNGVRPRVGRA